MSSKDKIAKISEDLSVRFGTWDRLHRFAEEYVAGTPSAVLAVRKGLKKADKAEAERLGVEPLKGIDQTTADVVFTALTTPEVVEVIRSCGGSETFCTAHSHPAGAGTDSVPVPPEPLTTEPCAGSSKSHGVLMAR